MKVLKLMMIASIALICLTGCDRATEKNIVCRTVNHEIVLITDVKVLMESDDKISQHTDSIISGLIDAEFISTGSCQFGLDNDSITDIGFEIIDLNKFNAGILPDTLDSLAARVVPISVQILDNSTYGYPDALDENDPIPSEGNWTGGMGCLGTFLNAGKFQGEGEKYLGFRFIHKGSYNYGWIKIYCSQHNDTLRIIEYAYNQLDNGEILAGQRE